MQGGISISDGYRPIFIDIGIVKRLVGREMPPLREKLRKLNWRCYDHIGINLISLGRGHVHPYITTSSCYRHIRGP